MFNIFNSNGEYNKYPCKDILHHALYFLENGDINSAYEEIICALDKAGDEVYDKEYKHLQDVRDNKIDNYNKGWQDAINLFLNTIATYDKFGYDGTKLMRLTKDNADDYVGYIHMNDVMKCANTIKERKRER